MVVNDRLEDALEQLVAIVSGELQRCNPGAEAKSREAGLPAAATTLQGQRGKAART